MTLTLSLSYPYLFKMTPHPRRRDFRKGEGVEIRSGRGIISELYKLPAWPLPVNGKLPTQSNVSLAVLYEKVNTTSSYNNQSGDAVKKVTEELLRTWKELLSSEVGLIDPHNIQKKIKQQIEKEKSSMKTNSFKPSSLRDKLKQNQKKLFDISLSKAEIPDQDKIFLEDQKTRRLMR